MSRLARKPIAFDPKVQTTYKNKELKVKGQLGELTYQIPEGIDLEIKDNQIQIVADLESSKVRMMAGTAGSIVNNMVTGVSQGFTKVLQLVGVGYRAQLSGQKLTLALGYSHPIEYELPKAVKAELDGTTKITLVSYDKQVLGQTAAEIRKYRPPEPYKGKGVLFEGEVIIRKAGKAAKTAG